MYLKTNAVCRSKIAVKIEVDMSPIAYQDKTEHQTTFSRFWLTILTY
jgi:hypothetical protein